MILSQPFYRKKKFQILVLILIPVFIYLLAFGRELGVIWNFTRAFLQLISGHLIGTLPVNLEFLRAVLLVGFIVLTFIGFTYATFYFASFDILPIQVSYQHRQTLSRILDFITFSHGPAIFISEGKKIASPGELTRRGRGVILVDVSSAVVLAGGGGMRKKSLLSSFFSFPSPVRRTRVKPNVRVESAGIVFTESGETIRGVVDLRPQVRIRKKVECSTRDGINLQTNIVATFTLGQPPDILKVGYTGKRHPDNLRVIYLKQEIDQTPGTPLGIKRTFISHLSEELDKEDREEIHRLVTLTKPFSMQKGPVDNPYEAPDPKPFSYNPEHVFAALYSQAQDVMKEAFIDWTELPTSEATKIFRNMITLETYDDLYQPTQPEIYPLSDLKKNFTTAVRNQGILAFQFVTHMDGRPFSIGQTWEEHRLAFSSVRELQTPKVLRARGIKIIAASFTELVPEDPAIRQQLLEAWKARWQNEAEETLALHEYDASRIIDKARAEAQAEMVMTFSSLLSKSNVTEEALTLRLFQALESATEVTSTRELMPGEIINTLTEMKEWLL